MKTAATLESAVSIEPFEPPSSFDADPHHAEKPVEARIDVAERISDTPTAGKHTGGREGDQHESDLGEWDAGDDVEKPLPRAWLLGNVFARRFVSSLLAEGGTGKTALRYAQYLSLVTGKPLTGDHVFRRCRVLIVSLEDDADELRRRILAAREHHAINLSEVRGWLFLAAPGNKWAN